jgi:ribosome biogenesis protein Nip4
MNPREFAKKFTDQAVIDESLLYNLQREYFLVGPTFRELIPNIQIRPDYLGTYLGEDSNKGFIPSFFLLEMLKPHSKTITLNERSSWLFICGRNVLFEGILKKDQIKNMDFVIVLNERGEVFGYGQYLRNEIRNLFDRGDFLRRERKKEEKPAGRESQIGNRGDKPAGRGRYRTREREKPAYGNTPIQPKKISNRAQRRKAKQAGSFRR